MLLSIEEARNVVVSAPPVSVNGHVGITAVLKKVYRSYGPAKPITNDVRSWEPLHVQLYEELRARIDKAKITNSNLAINVTRSVALILPESLCGNDIRRDVIADLLRKNQKYTKTAIKDIFTRRRVCMRIGTAIDLEIKRQFRVGRGPLVTALKKDYHIVPLAAAVRVSSSSRHGCFICKKGHSPPPIPGFEKHFTEVDVMGFDTRAQQVCLLEIKTTTTNTIIPAVHRMNVAQTWIAEQLAKATFPQLHEDFASYLVYVNARTQRIVKVYNIDTFINKPCKGTLKKFTCLRYICFTREHLL